VSCRNTRCSTPNYKRSCRLEDAATLAYGVYPCAGLVAAAASRSGFCGLACICNREAVFSCPGAQHYSVIVVDYICYFHWGG